MPPLELIAAAEAPSVWPPSITDGADLATKGPALQALLKALRGAEGVVVAAHEYRRLCSGLSLREVLRNAPRGEPLDLERSVEPVRNIEL